MNIHFHHARPRRPARMFQFSPGMLIIAGLFLGMLLPMWIKIITK